MDETHFPPPKVRGELPAPYRAIYDEHYKNNRAGATAASFFSSRMERWMHRKVAADARDRDDLITLEVGAGTLNQLSYERTAVYDIVEPYEALYRLSPNLPRVRHIYGDLSEVPGERVYDRVTSVAAFEHICNLYEVAAHCRRLLRPGGCLRVAVPNEGRFLWKLAYTMTTGLEFRLKYHLDYSVLMNYEHVNTADEIERVLTDAFSSVRLSLMGPSRDLALYRYYECKSS